MKYSKKKIGKTKVGQVIEVTWVDISVDATLDGSSSSLVEAYTDTEYKTIGYFLGINSQSRVLLLSNDIRNDKEDEYRGTMCIPLSVIKEFKSL
jgi:hypothetical protein